MPSIANNKRLLSRKNRKTSTSFFLNDKKRKQLDQSSQKQLNKLKRQISIYIDKICSFLQNCHSKISSISITIKKSSEKIQFFESQSDLYMSIGSAKKITSTAIINTRTHKKQQKKQWPFFFETKIEHSFLPLLQTFWWKNREIFWKTHSRLGFFQRVGFRMKKITTRRTRNYENYNSSIFDSKNMQRISIWKTKEKKLRILAQKFCIASEV